MLHPVILAGGLGKQLWPMSRTSYPKQFLTILGEKTLLQKNMELLDAFSTTPPLLICNEEHRFIIAEQLREIDLLDHNIVLEPASRNTAPAIALSALIAISSNKNALLLVLATDHIISDKTAFQNTIKKAIPVAESGELITFGVKPTHAETSYGYIRRGNPVNYFFKATEFVENPDSDRARNFISSRDYYWNSGIFLFRADRYLEELKAYSPDIYESCKTALKNSQFDLDFIRIDNRAFQACPSKSIDCAIMQHTNHASVVPLDAGWSDISSWAALWGLGEKDKENNVCKGDVICHLTKNTYVFSENALVGTVGIKDLIIVQTKDAILVAHQKHAQEISHIVATLEAQNRVEHKIHREVYRPWGKYDSVDKGFRYQVKRITVNSGEKLSVQMHHHRAEHWIIVSGTAYVTIDDHEKMLTENQSIYIPLGSVHALENRGKIPLELIEVQSGTYLGEDDIVRFEDRYGRF